MTEINTDPASSDFNSYASVDDLRDFASARGYDVPDDSDQCARLLFRAMDYLTSLSWRGWKTSRTQPLAWPRSGVMIEGEVQDDKTIPRQLIQAQCRLAIEAADGVLDVAIVRGVTMETAGKVTMQYSGENDSGEIYFPWLAGLLRGLMAFAVNTVAERG